MTKPTERKGLLNPLFKYVRSDETDIRRTFARERERQRQLMEQREWQADVASALQEDLDPLAGLVPLLRTLKGGY